jgi:polysaccharide biosynthesis transport protein
MSMNGNIIPSSNPPTRLGTTSGGRSSRSAKANGFDARQGLVALRRRWLLITVLGIIVAAIAGASVWFFLPLGSQTAMRTLYIASVAPAVAFESREKTTDFNTFKQTQVSLVRSRLVLNVALRSPKVANLRILETVPDHVEWLEREVRVNFGSSPEILQISMQGSVEEMKELSLLVDAVTAAYLKEVVDVEADKHKARVFLLKDIAGRYDKRLKNIRSSMRKLREQLGTGNAESVILKQQMAQREYEQVSRELTGRRSEMRSLRTLLSQMEAGKTDGFSVSPEEVETALEKDRSLAELTTQIAKLEGKVEKAASRAVRGREEPVVRQMQTDLDSKRAEAKAKRESLRKAMTDDLKATKARAAIAGLASLKFRLLTLENLAKVEVNDCKRLILEAKQLNVKALDLEDFKSEIDQAETMAQFLNKKVETMTVEDEAPARIRQLDPEVLIIRPDEQMRKARFSGLAGGAGLLLVAVMVVFFEVQARRLGSPSEVADQLGMPVIGSLPYFKGNRRGPLAEQHLKEAIDSTRTLLLHASDSDKLSIILIASPVAGEGKTSLACHLAASLARAGRRTVLIDGDLRKPDAHRVFAAPPLPGLCEVVRGECPLGEALYETGIPGLRVLAAGQVDERALSAVAQTGFATLVEQLRPQADYIIVDSSPILAVPDALMFAKNVDGVLFAIMQNETRTPWLVKATEKMTRVGGRILGVVINGAQDAEQSAYKNYSYTLNSKAQAGGK